LDFAVAAGEFVDSAIAGDAAVRAIAAISSGFNMIFSSFDVAGAARWRPLATG
jgi:hypothetical protein